MIYSISPIGKQGLQARSRPWLVFLFLTAVFFFVYHDISYSRYGIGNYDAPEDAIATEVAGGSSSRRLALLALAIFAIASLIRHRSDGWPQIKGPMGWILVGFVGWAFLSPIWAEDKALTVTRVGVLGILCLAALTLTRRFSLREIILWTFFASGSYVIVAVLIEAYFGTFRPLSSGYRFSGTLHPNSQGINCALLMLSGIAAGHVEKHRRKFFRMGALIGFGFLVLTASRTAFAAALLTTAIYLGVVCSKRAKMAVGYGVSIVFCVLLMVLGSAFLPDLKSAVMLGRDDSSNSSFNGRTGIWDEIGDYVQRRPILGYGYEGFWTPARISEVSEKEKWGIPNSHSAYLDCLLTLGAVGLIAYVLLLLAGITRAFRYYKFSHDPAYAFCATLLLFCALDGFLESAIVDPSLAMFLALIAFLNLAVVADSQSLRFNDLPARLHSMNAEASGVFRMRL
jgi:exopolysaccharide production protein ExoQ